MIQPLLLLVIRSKEHHFVPWDIVCTFFFHPPSSDFPFNNNLVLNFRYILSIITEHWNTGRVRNVQCGDGRAAYRTLVSSLSFIFEWKGMYRLKAEEQSEDGDGGAWCAARCCCEDVGYKMSVSVLDPQKRTDQKKNRKGADPASATPSCRNLPLLGWTV